MEGHSIHGASSVSGLLNCRVMTVHEVLRRGRHTAVHTCIACGHLWVCIASTGHGNPPSQGALPASASCDMSSCHRMCSMKVCCRSLNVTEHNFVLLVRRFFSPWLVLVVRVVLQERKNKCKVMFSDQI